MPETTSYDPSKLFAGHNPPALTQPITVLDGQTLAQFEIVETDLVGKVIAHVGINEVDDTIQPLVAGVMINASAPSGADGAASMWTSGCFFASQLVWPADTNTDLLKSKLLEGSDIKVVFQDTGEV